MRGLPPEVSLRKSLPERSTLQGEILSSDKELRALTALDFRGRFCSNRASGDWEPGSGAGVDGRKRIEGLEQSGLQEAFEPMRRQERGRKEIGERSGFRPEECKFRGCVRWKSAAEEQKGEVRGARRLQSRILQDAVWSQRIDGCFFGRGVFERWFCILTRFEVCLEGVRGAIGAWGRLIWVICLWGGFFAGIPVHGSVQREPLREFRFEISGARGDSSSVAEVRVESLLLKKDGRSFSNWLRLRGMSRFVAEGVSIRMQSFEFAVLRQLPTKLREKAQGGPVEMRHLRLFAPGDTVPRLIAKEVEVHPNGVWTLRKVLLAGNPSISSCTLKLEGKEDPQLRSASGKNVSLRSLLADPSPF